MVCIRHSRLAVLGAAALSAGAAAPAALAEGAAPAAKGNKSAAHLRVGTARTDVLAGKRVVVHGTLTPHAAHRRVTLQVRRGSGPWSTVGNAQTRAGGAYRLRYSADQIGSYSSRVLYQGGSDSRSTHATLGSLNVYRRVFVSHYGGGGSLACGGTLNAGTIGVANKTLPCGTKVHLRYRGKQMTVRVIDRGPYVAGRDYDLTDATQQALGAGDLTTIEATR